MREVSDVRAATREAQKAQREVEPDEQHHEREHAHRDHPEQIHLLLRPLQRVRAHDAEDRARRTEEEIVAVAEEERVADEPTETAQQIEEDELLQSPVVLEPRTEDEQRVHVPEQVPEVTVDEHVRGDRPPSSGGGRKIEAERVLHGGRRNDRHLQEQNRDVDRDQRLHGGGHPRIVLLVRRRIAHRPAMDG